MRCSWLTIAGEDEKNTDKLVEYVQLNNAALQGKRALQEWRETIRSRDMAGAPSAHEHAWHIGCPQRWRLLMGAMACISLTGAALLAARARKFR